MKYLFDKRLQGQRLIRQLVQMAAPAAGESRRDMTRQAHHARTVAVGGTQSRGCIQHPGTRHDGEHAGFTGRSGVSHGHIGSRLLVTRQDQTDAGPCDAVEKRINLSARYAEDDIGPIPRSGQDDSFASRREGVSHAARGRKTSSLPYLRHPNVIRIE
jgi:hypothetical protein